MPSYWQYQRHQGRDSDSLDLWRVTQVRDMIITSARFQHRMILSLFEAEHCIQRQVETKRVIHILCTRRHAAAALVG